MGLQSSFTKEPVPCMLESNFYFTIITVITVLTWFFVFSVLLFSISEIAFRS